MSNPWLKKNPFMSVWLSSANRMAGPLRSHATAYVKRQMSTAAADASRESLKLWFGTVPRVVGKSKPKRRR